MAEEQKQLQQNNLTEFSKGLHLDNSLVDQPKGTYRFALNSVNETELGDSGFIGNEESNELCGTITEGFTPIGKVYIGDNSTAIFSVNGTTSEIGIIKDCVYEVFVNDLTSPFKEKLSFSLTHQIEAVYRLRKGCEKTIYFTDGLNPPRHFNFNKVNQFKSNSQWFSSKFSLYKKIKTFPTIDTVEVLDNSGNLITGSYSILVQHLDEDFNGTEFHEIIRDINIYNDPSTKDFTSIQGSSNIGDTEGGFKYSNTSKAISITLENVDKDFSYVRFAIVEKTVGKGTFNKVTYSGPISVNSPIFTYTGTNGAENGTIEDVQLFNINPGINTARHIEQIDNMLILGDIGGEQIELCKLQKYASKVSVDCFVKDVILTTIKDKNNPKNPLVNYNGIGYQPGDIYSLGLIYVFEDYTFSPVLHIPGKSSDVTSEYVYSEETGVYPMVSGTNQNSSDVYLEENTSCTGSFWGVDTEGKPLKNTNVRHHRFPTRDQIGIDFVTRVDTSGGIVKYKQIVLNILGQLKKQIGETPTPNFSLKVKFKRNNVEEEFTTDVEASANIPLTSVSSEIFVDSDVLTDIKLYYIEQVAEGITPTEVELIVTNKTTTEQENGLTYTVNTVELNENSIKSIYKVPILGLKLSNVTLPPEYEIGKKIIGYKIVRQERTDSDKNILDSAVVFPMTKSGRNVSTALLAPEYFMYPQGPASTCEGSEDATFPTCYNISKRNLMLVSLGHKFMDKTYDGFTSVEQVGNFEKEYVARSASSTQNIFEGSSDEGNSDGKTSDTDGYSLRHGYRFTGVKYKPTVGTPLIVSSNNTRTFNLNAVNYADTEDNQETLYNMSCDNKALVLSSTESGVDLRTYRPNKHNFPYVYIKKDNTSFYQNFRSNSYHAISNGILTSQTCKVFGGDTYVTPLRYSNHVFGNGVAALRRQKVNFWTAIGAALLAVISVVLAPFTLGASFYLFLASTAFAIAAIASGAAAFIQADKFSEIYRDKWQNNLDKTVFDFIYARLFIREHPQNIIEGSTEPSEYYLSWSDDTFRWFGDIVGDLWFESTLNASLRVPPTTMNNNYLYPLTPYMNDKTDAMYVLSQAEYVPNSLVGKRFHRYVDPNVAVEQPEEWYFFKKILISDNTKPSGYFYTGISLPQIYLINPDLHFSSGVKKFYTIPIEYDCCSNCAESFPHRIHYSQQSFQEEKADNFRIFLPNNYRDIEGNTGRINNIFRIGNNLFAHTKEGLWRMGRSYQERVTDNVVSFIGTGSYFEIPPQKIIDDDTGSSAGTQHKWASVKTPMGYFFPSVNQKKIYQFNGEQLKAISDNGLSNWFKNNMEISNLEFEDNPSNPKGSGYISVYDSRKERIIFTKIDKNSELNNSWTMSYSLKNNSWVSWHSYIPSFYYSIPENFYSFSNIKKGIWKHNVVGKYQTYYGQYAPHILELVSISNPLTTKVWNYLMLQTEVKEYDTASKEYFEQKDITFNKATLYNSRQSSGLMNLVVKDSSLNNENYMMNEVINTNDNVSIIDRNERDWSINDFRDIRIDYTKPIWKSDKSNFTTTHYIDKELNTSTLDINKDWTQLESFRDKYLVVRYIFDKFADKKLITNFSIENEQQSFR